MKRIIILYVAFAIILSQLVMALGEISQSTNRLNYYEARSHTTTLTNNGAASVYVNVSAADGFNFTGCTGCTSNPTLAQFDLSPNESQSYTVTSSASNPEYKLTTLQLTTNNTYTVEKSLSYLRIQDQEIFHTLVEFGRGRGNYFYDTFSSGKAGSGHTGTGCNYVPNGTMFELNFLHKILNIRQYFNDASLVAENATFTCSYPNRTIVRTHLGTAISQDSTETNVTYFIDQVEGSWERMGYLGMDFDANEQNVGDNLTISCGNIRYVLSGAYGNVTVFGGGISFDLQVRDREPFTASASTAATIGNGTQEVLITYSITNNELYTANDVIIEVEAPQYATFIGTRGELWGSALDQYRIEKAELRPNETEIIILVARFDTSSAPNITSINLTKEIKIKYVTCWELNAYNPAEYMQYLYGIGAASVTLGAPASIVSVMGRLEQIYNLMTYINSTTVAINNTVNTIETIVDVINRTTIDTNLIVKQINNTVQNISNKTTQILNNTNTILNDTAVIKELIDCDNINDSAMCSALDDMNSTATNIKNLIIDINQTLSNLSINVTVDLSDQNLSINVTPDLTNISIILDDIKAELNCSNVTSEPNTSICKRLIRIENNTIIINNTANDINNLVNYFNATVFGNITLQQLYDSISNVTIDTSDLLTEIRRIREFDEELVFLVTDAFGLAQEARNAVTEGDLSEAANKLREANDRLAQATQRLMESGKEAESGLTTEGTSVPLLAFIAILVCLVIFVLFYLFQKVPEEPGSQEPKEEPSKSQ